MCFRPSSVSREQKCSKCQTANSAGADVCVECGAIMARTPLPAGAPGAPSAPGVKAPGAPSVPTAPSARPSTQWPEDTAGSARGVRVASE